MNHILLSQYCWFKKKTIEKTTKKPLKRPSQNGQVQNNLCKMALWSSQIRAIWGTFWSIFLIKKTLFSFLVVNDGDKLKSSKCKWQWQWSYFSLVPISSNNEHIEKEGKKERKGDGENWPKLGLFLHTTMNIGNEGEG